MSGIPRGPTPAANCARCGAKKRGAHALLCPARAAAARPPAKEDVSRAPDRTRASLKRSPRRPKAAPGMARAPTGPLCRGRSSRAPGLLAAPGVWLGDRPGRFFWGEEAGKDFLGEFDGTGDTR